MAYNPPHERIPNRRIIKGARRMPAPSQQTFFTVTERKGLEQERVDDSDHCIHRRVYLFNCSLLQTLAIRRMLHFEMQLTSDMREA